MHTKFQRLISACKNQTQLKNEKFCRQSGNDHGRWSGDGGAPGAMGQPKPSDRVVRRVRSLHGEPGERGGVRGERRDAHRQLRDRRPGAPARRRLGDHAAAVGRRRVHRTDTAAALVLSDIRRQADTPQPNPSDANNV